METERLVVIGAGGMAQCVLDLVDVINRETERRIEVVGAIADPFPDEGMLARLNARGVAYLGGLQGEWFSKVRPEDASFVIGFANSEARMKVDSLLSALSYQSMTLVHPNVHIGFGSQVGPGSVICSHVSIENHVRLGRHIHVNQNSTIGHNTVLEDYCTVSPLVAISGDVTVSRATFFGTGSAVREKLTIGCPGTVIGMGATLVTSVDAMAAYGQSPTLVGTPARVTRSSIPTITGTDGVVYRMDEIPPEVR